MMQNLKRVDWYPICLGGGTGRGVWGVGGPSGVSTPKSGHAFQEALVSKIFGRHVSNRLNYIIEILSSRSVD